MYSMRNIYYALPISICNALPTPNSNSRLALTLVQTHQRTIYSTVSCSRTREKEFTTRWCSGNMLIGCTIGSHYITPVVGRLQSQDGVTAFLVVCAFSFTRSLAFFYPPRVHDVTWKIDAPLGLFTCHSNRSASLRALVGTTAKSSWLFREETYLRISSSRSSTNLKSFILPCFSIYPNIFFLYTIHLPNQ